MRDSIKPRERDAIIQSLRAGVVPRVGLRHLQVGRLDEVNAVLKDLERIESGGASVRFIIGRYGAGKSFFLNLARTVALERRFVVAHADITLERRLHGSAGQARNLYAELMRNLSTRAKPEGGAIANVVERWVSDLDHDIRSSGGTDPDVFKEIKTRLKPLQDLVSGFDFATVVSRYVEGFQAHNDDLMSSALRWLRAEYRTKTEARHDLDVRSIIDDAQFYDYLKLFASFAKLAGYAGLLINIDEMGVFSHRLNSSQARTANYEVILRILNDCLQGNVAGLGFFFGGTNTFLEDRRRGVYSYDALATRLADNTFAGTGLKDFTGPVLRLANLSPEDLFVLLHNIRVVFALGDPARFLVDDNGMKQFMSHCASTLGAEFYLTPRDAVKGFVQLLSVIEQNPGSTWQTVLNEMRIDRSIDPESGPPDPDDEPPSATAPARSGDDDLASFKL
jgi:BREX system ATP-binding protein BrxC/D